MRSFVALSFVCLGTFACEAGGGDPSDASLEAPDADHTPDVGIPQDASSSPDDAGEPQDACNIVAPTECPQPAPTYADVEPIFQARCVECHSGMPGGPWPLTSYAHIVVWSLEIRAAMLNCVMPPRDSGKTMPDAERYQLLDWLRCGGPP